MAMLATAAAAVVGEVLDFPEFDDSDFDNLEALLTVSPRKAKSAETKPVATVTRLETPVAFGIVLSLTESVCKCCKIPERLVVGRFIKYHFKGGVSIRPVNQANVLDFERIEKSGKGREVEIVGKVEIPACAVCSAEMLRAWNADAERGVK